MKLIWIAYLPEYSKYHFESRFNKGVHRAHCPVRESMAMFAIGYHFKNFLIPTSSELILSNWNPRITLWLSRVNLFLEFVFRESITLANPQLCLRRLGPLEFKMVKWVMLEIATYGICQTNFRSVIRCIREYAFVGYFWLKWLCFT